MKKITGLILALLSFSLLCNDLAAQRKANPRLFSHANETPDSVETSISSLASYLREPAQNEREIVETIFYWMAIHIKYHDDPDYEMVYADSIVSVTFRTRQAGCEGTARLFKALCDSARIECVVIFGFAEGYGFDRQRSSRPNHGWNAVKIDGQWLLVDATWGSGGATSEGDQAVYITALDLRYLFADPKDFIIDHFPEDSKWQLLTKPISKKTFYSDEYELKRLAKLGW